MVLYVDGGVLDFEPVSSVVVSVVIAALTFLTALSFRDSVTQTIALITPDHRTKKLVITFCCTLLFLFLTVLLAYTFQTTS